MSPDEIIRKDYDLRCLYPEIDPVFLDWLHTNGFFTAPASTEHHGNYEGGLFDHSFAVAVQLQHLTDDNKLIWANERSPVIVGLFHDICKMDQYRHPAKEVHIGEKFSAEGLNLDKWEHRDDMLLRGHGDKSIMILSSHIQLTEEEVMCIRYHMGAFTDKAEWNYYTRAVRAFPNVLWTHHADMIAAHVMGL